MQCNVRIVLQNDKQRKYGTSTSIFNIKRIKHDLNTRLCTSVFKYINKKQTPRFLFR